MFCIVFVSDFKVPLYWDSLVPGQTLQVIPLIPLSAEFERVKADFRRTCLRTVLKVHSLLVTKITSSVVIVHYQNVTLLYHNTSIINNDQCCNNTIRFPEKPLVKVFICLLYFVNEKKCGKR